MKTKIKKSVPVRSVNGSALAQEAARWERLDRAVDSIEGAYLASARFSIGELSEKVLKAAKNFTGSSYGFAAYLDQKTGWMISPTLTRKARKGRAAAGKPLVFKEFAGLWGWALKNKKPILTNAAASDPRSGGIPRGHIKIDKFLAAPAVFNRSLAGIIALANPGRDYDPRDLASLKRLARVYAIIIQRKLAEDRLKESEEKYRAIINASRDITFAINLEGRITYISRQVRDYGYSPRGMIGRHFIEFIHPDDRYFISQAFAKVVKTGVPLPVLRYLLKKKDGSYFHAEQKSGIIAKDGKPSMLSGVIRDVTERDQLRRRVEENEKTLQAIFDTAKDSIFIKDVRGRYVKVNKACAEFFGANPELMIGKTDAGIFPESAARDALKQDRLVLKKGETLSVDNLRETAGGRRIFNMIKTPLKNANKEITGMLVIARDVTERKELEAELVKTKAMEAVSKVARPAAHDFNNILAAINGYAILIVETLKAGNPVKPEIEQILNAVKRAAAITERLQTYGSGTGKKPAQ